MHSSSGFIQDQNFHVTCHQQSSCCLIFTQMENTFLGINIQLNILQNMIFYACFNINTLLLLTAFHKEYNLVIELTSFPTISTKFYCSKKREKKGIKYLATNHHMVLSLLQTGSHHSSSQVHHRMIHCNPFQTGSRYQYLKQIYITFFKVKVKKLKIKSTLKGLIGKKRTKINQKLK